MNSPVDYKMRLGAALKQCREDAQLDRDTAAAALECSEDKVRTIERGRVGVSEEDLAVLLDLYRVPDAEQTALKQLAVEARRRQSRTPWGAFIPDRLRRFFDLESTALDMRVHQEGMPYGSLQTEELARLLISADDSRSPREVDGLVQARMVRRERLFGPRAPQMTAIMPESVLACAPAPVMRRQLRYLVDIVSSLPNVTLLMVPRGADPYTALGFSFVLFDTPTRPVGYMEALTGDAMTFETPDRLAQLERAWAGLVRRTLPADDSVRLLDNAAAHL